jgi:hypothetical protein
VTRNYNNNNNNNNNNKNSITAEINHRILSGNRCYYDIRNLLQSRILNNGTKCKIYKTLIRPLVLYGTDYWTLTKADEEKLRIFERRILRSIYGPTCEDGVWRIKYNDELYSLYKDADIVRIIKVPVTRIRREISSSHGGEYEVQICLMGYTAV